MKILLTGATGLVGRRLVKTLTAGGHVVNFLTTNPDKVSRISDAKGYIWDPGRGFIDEAAFIGVDTIVHLAGESIAGKWTPETKQAILESRVVTANLIFKILKTQPHQVQQFVSASGIGFYPNSETAHYTETHSTPDDGFVGQVVVKWENAAQRMASLGIATAILRTGLVLAREGGALAEMEKSFRLGLGAPLGSGKQIYSWIHLDDLAEMYKFVIENRLSGVFNAVSPQPVSNREFTRHLAQAMKKPAFLPPVPEFVLKLMLGEMHQILVTGQYVSADKIIGEGFSFKFPTLSEALKALY